MSCNICYHNNFDSSAMDDLEAMCGCDCHDEIEDNVCSDCDLDYPKCICYGDNEN